MNEITINETELNMARKSLMKSDFCEIKVSIKDDEQKLTRNFAVHHDNLRVSHDDPELKTIVGQTMVDFKGDIAQSNTTVTIKYVW